MDADRRQGAGAPAAPAPTVLVVSAALADGGTALFLVDGRRRGSDPHRLPRRTTAAAPRSVAFDGTPATPLGDGRRRDRRASRGRSAAARIAYGQRGDRRDGQPRSRTTTEYLKTRKQFGVTLNTFQALTFRAADMYVSLELARSIALWATMVWRQDAGGDVVRGRRPRPAAGQPRRPAHRPGGDPAARRHRRDRGVHASATTPAGSPRIDHLLGDGDWALARLAENVGELRDGRPAGRALRPVALNEGPPAHHDRLARSAAARPAGARASTAAPRAAPARNRCRRCVHDRPRPADTDVLAAAAGTPPAARRPRRPTRWDRVCGCSRNRWRRLRTRTRWPTSAARPERITARPARRCAPGRRGARTSPPAGRRGRRDHPGAAPRRRVA